MEKKTRKPKLGEIIVISGTNEIVICLKVPGKGTFTNRLSNHDFGVYEHVGKLNKKQAKIYWGADAKRRMNAILKIKRGEK